MIHKAMDHILVVASQGRRNLIASVPMKRNVLLINPWIYDFAAYDYWMKPMGILWLGAMLRRHDIEVRLIDCLNTAPLPGVKDPHVKIPHRKPGGHGKLPKTIVDKPQALKKFKGNYARYGISVPFFRKLLLSYPPPDLVLVTSAMTYWYPGIRDVILLVRDTYPSTPIILGGIYATLCPDHASGLGADLVLTGPGEEHLHLIISDFLGLEPTTCKGMAPGFPYPAYDLMGRPDQIPIMTSRGCPFRCAYCASDRLFPRFVQRTPGEVVDELIHWHNYFNVCDFSFYDDAFLIHPERMALPLLRLLGGLPWEGRFHCPNGMHVRGITAEIARLLRKAGFITLRFGFETADDKRQREMGGKVYREELRQAVAYLQEAGYGGWDIGVYCLCGLPGQTAEEVRETVSFVKSLGVRPIIAEYSPIPGTALWMEAKAASPYPLDEEPLYHNNTLMPCRHVSLSEGAYREIRAAARSL